MQIYFLAVLKVIEPFFALCADAKRFETRQI